MKKYRFLLSCLISLMCFFPLASCEISNLSSNQTEGGVSVTTSSNSGTSSSSAKNTSESAYYQNVDWTLSGAALKEELRKATPLSGVMTYDDVKTNFLTTDVDDEGKLIDIYSNTRWQADQRGASATSEGIGWNNEHIIPQSIFNKELPMKADMNHLFPTDIYVNNHRADYPHGIVGNATETFKNESVLGSGDNTLNHGYTNIVYQPIREYEGDIARTYFYFVTAYGDKLASFKNYPAFVHNSYPSLASWAIKTYLKWNEEDPVSAKEKKRNEAVYSIQKNRNPFIDRPEAAEQIWGSLA